MKENVIDNELNSRLEIWKRLNQEFGIVGIKAQIPRQLGIYGGGGQGIWRNTERTSVLTGDEAGITVGVLHTGKIYADDFFEDGIIYHYPKTDRPPTVDRNEITATKAAATLGLPIFVMSVNADDASLRDVNLGWVAGWDDASNIFLILFQREAPKELILEIDDHTGFSVVGNDERKLRLTKTRTGQATFRFNVFKRYGAQCAVCEVSVAELLDAIHIVPKSKQGIDDARNGLVLCVLHHRAYDAHLFSINPHNNAIQYAKHITKQSLGIAYSNLQHLKNLPHSDALSWNWREFVKANKETT